MPRPKLPMKGFPIKGAVKATGEFIVATMQSKEYKGITAEDLKQLLESGHPVTVIDCRDVASFGVGHIPGAINIHYREFMDRSCEVPNSAPVVTACYFGFYSRAAAQKLATSGHAPATSLLGGMMAWLAAGYPLDVEEPPIK